MRYFLALDAGGTKTECVLADEEREIVRVHDGTIKVLRADVEVARKNLDSLLGKLVAASGVNLKTITATCIGTSGSTVPYVVQFLKENLQARVGGELEICGDEMIALDSAFPGGSGVLVIAGTGSNVVGRSRSGVITHAGGTGPALSDEGSGHWIGHQGLRYAFRALDERQPTTLIDDILKHWNLSSLKDLVGVANSAHVPNFSTLTPVIVDAAERGDLVAQKVLQLGGEELARLVLLVLGHLQEIDGLTGDVVPDVAVTGSVIKNVKQVRNAMVSTLQQKYPSVKVLPEAVDPVLGALWRARKLCYV